VEFGDFGLASGFLALQTTSRVHTLLFTSLLTQTTVTVTTNKITFSFVDSQTFS
jgi:hypothetical protein